MQTIAVVGLGYVGLPLSLQFARSGVRVIGLDVDVAKVDAIAKGLSYIRHHNHPDINPTASTGYAERQPHLEGRHWQTVQPEALAQTR